MVYSGGFYFSNIINSLRDLQSDIVEKEKIFIFQETKNHVEISHISVFAFCISGIFSIEA
ncbi:MAG TPA: hypothetical protein DIT10_14665 [Chryseobacterium sp.]|nr:hypothetical protein [Chryseobacterium sp.]